MKLGLHVTSFTWPSAPQSIPETLRSIARTAEDAGFHSVSVMDHFFQMEQMGGPAQPMLEAYSTLNFLAASTSRVKLGALVTGVTYRHPGALVKSVSTLDVLSGGRAELGIGAGWYEREARGLGLPFPPTKERFERLEETLQIAHHMWSTTTEAPFEGRHYTLAEPTNLPQPISKPHPPINIGGLGERKTLRFVAQYGDACNLFSFAGPDFVRAKLEVLRRHCDAVGRPYEQIERTGLTDLDLRTTSVDDAIAMLRGLSDAGLQRVMIMLPDVEELRSIEVVGRQIVPVVSEFGEA
jgi:F420-dependent oxidoreductase-like protein